MSLQTLHLSRRQVLGMAAGGAVGAVGLRAVALHLGSGSIASAPGPNGSWRSPLGDSRARAAHLLRRAGFTPSADELDRAASMTYADLVDSVVNQKPSLMPLPSGDITKYQVTTTAWYEHMATTPAQFPERMALFWHGLLTSDYRKGGRTGPLVWQQCQLYRTTGLTDWRSLLVATTYDPLMAHYLDLVDSSGRSPNENYARELMELFTLGVGNFTEDDVREGARALTGIQVRIVDKNGKPVTPPKRDKSDPQAVYDAISRLAQDGARWEGVLNPRRHDTESKTFLGKSGNLKPEDVIDTILSKDAAATFLATKALVHFAMPQPSSDYVNRIATQFRTSKYDVKTLMRSIFLSEEFTSPDNYRSLVRSPADVMVSAMRLLGKPDLAPQAVAAGPAMDQVLYDPPTVGGWPANGGWVSSSAWLGRLNFAAYAVQNATSLPDPGKAVQNVLDGTVGPDTAAVYNASGADSDRWYAILASPEFQLK
jgi:uncharacterized protein (DUF1800 family)